MITVGVLCEGQTEENMVRDFLAPELFKAGIILVPTILLTGTRAGGPSGRGGVTSCWPLPTWTKSASTEAPSSSIVPARWAAVS